MPIKHPELFEALGVAQPKGVLLYGPPGTGKTLLARAVAHHTDCTFIRVSGSELVQKYIGEGSRMVRELFVMARLDRDCWEMDCSGFTFETVGGLHVQRLGILFGILRTPLRARAGCDWCVGGRVHLCY